MGSRGGRPPAVDRADYRNRNVVERGFCDVKQWRGLATRYDKFALTFRGGVVLKAIVIWLRALDTHLWGLPVSRYSAWWALRQAPGRAAPSPSDAATCGDGNCPGGGHIRREREKQWWMSTAVWQ